MYNYKELKKLLEAKYTEFNTTDFIKSDPIQIPKNFSRKEDIEISAFLVSIIAWGQRKSIINNGNKLMQLMDNSPSDFIKNHQERDLKRFVDFKHRTFNGDDCIFFISSLQNIYKNHNGLESVFEKNANKGDNLVESLAYFRDVFFEIEGLERTKKHISNVRKNSAAKRINMFLRWMVRNDNHNVDFGIWNTISTSKLLLPLDVHSSNVSRKLGLLERKQNDLKAVVELTQNLKKFDVIDPVKYDFALFGMGVSGQM